MSSATWTAESIASSAAPLRSYCWRIVQGRLSGAAAKLTDTLSEQIALERVIDEFERELADIPMECRHLDLPLSKPFRSLPYRINSRFRRAGSRDGVFYAAESLETALAETAFHRLLFFAESHDASWPANPIEHTAFSASITSEKAIDLSMPPLDSDEKLWTDPTDYAACLDLSDVARDAGMEIIRYKSARDRLGRANVAVLVCRVFDNSHVLEEQTWHLHLDRNGVRATCEYPYENMEFDRSAFIADPRIATLSWERD